MVKRTGLEALKDDLAAAEALRLRLDEQRVRREATQEAAREAVNATRTAIRETDQEIARLRNAIEVIEPKGDGDADA